MKRIGWFTTARGLGSMNLFRTVLNRIDQGDINGEIAFMFINREVKGNDNRRLMVQMAKDRGIPVIILPSDGFRQDLKEKDMALWRDAYGKEMRAMIADHPMDFGVLAGYMLILDPQTCRENVLINLHPALPDTYKGTWEEVVQKVVENRDDRYGATVHVCTPDLDRGDTIAYDSFDIKALRARSVNDDELRKLVRAEGVRREAPLLMKVVELLAKGDIVIRDGHTYDRSGRSLKEPQCLAEEVDRSLS
ncbi:MAG: hypothetical protein LLG16_06675 [Euryarchaeota archaeon]|nr:hypothetical protein [Euryarchaeota archaeon]